MEEVKSAFNAYCKNNSIQIITRDNGVNNSRMDSKEERSVTLPNSKRIK